MTNLDFLAGLPAVLGVGGYVAYQISRLRESSSPILKTIVEIIKTKGETLPELDGRLTAKQVFGLLQKKPRAEENSRREGLFATRIRHETRRTVTSVRNGWTIIGSSHVPWHIWVPSND